MIHLNTETLINSYFYYLNQYYVPAYLTKRINNNEFKTITYNQVSGIANTNGFFNEVKRNWFTVGNRTFPLFEHSIKNIELPTINMELDINDFMSIVEPEWSSVSYPETLSWVAKTNGHVGDISTILIPKLSFLKKLKAFGASKDITIPVYDLNKKKLDHMRLDSIKPGARTPQVFIAKFIFQNFDHTVLILPRFSVETYSGWGEKISEFMNDYISKGETIFSIKTNREYKSLNLFWDTLADLLPTESAIALDTSISSRPIVAADPIKILPNTPELAECFNKKKENNSLKAKLTSTTANLNTIYQTIDNTNRKIEDLSVQLSATKRILNEKEQTKLQTVSVQNQLKDSYSLASSEYNLLISKIPPLTLKESSRFNNYKLIHLEINTKYGTYYLIDLPSIVNELLTTDSEILNLSCDLITISPSIIEVDSADKKANETIKVLGGPYSIHIQYNSIGLHGYIKARDLNSIVGISPAAGDIINIKAHPHSASVPANRTQVTSLTSAFSKQTKICFGEAELDIINAIKAGNISILIGAINSWVTSAWSRDQWGAEYTWFPIAKTK